MSRRTSRFAMAILIGLLGADGPRAQFTEKELAARTADQKFLTRARVLDSRRMSAREGVTRPYKITLRRNGRSESALCKDVDGLLNGHLESWRYEVAAYRLDRWLGLGMVPPTVERRFLETRGSCQLWVQVWKPLREVRTQRLVPPPEHTLAHNRAIDLQRAFDNLIGNVDRHPGNVLLTEDWRVILIDHSRAFRTGDTHTTRLIYDVNHPDGPHPVRSVPASVLGRLEQLDADVLERITGDLLTAEERGGVIARRSLLLRALEERIARAGRDAVVYDREDAPRRPP